MVNKHKQKNEETFRIYGKSNKELNAIIKKKFQMFVKIKNGGKQKKSSKIFRKYRFLMM